MAEKKVAIITGASSGIGYELAKLMSKSGYDLVLGYRNIEQKDQLIAELSANGSKVIVVQTDVSIQKDCEKLVQECIQIFGKIDVLVNNAGMTMRGLFHETSLEVHQKLMNINYWGTAYCTYFAMPQLLKSKGVIVGISSIAGFKGLPTRTGYSSSKYAMEGLLDALRTENLKTGVSVITFRPGFTATNIRNTALDSSGNPQGKSHKEEEKMMTAKEVAFELLKDIERRKNGRVLTLTGKLTWVLNKFFPDFVSKLVYKNVKSEEGSMLV
jgi:short-subunit dehydrogenase